MKSIKLKECNVLSTDSTLFVDVDDTLILWDTLNNKQSGYNKLKTYTTPNKNLERSITVEDPHMPGHMMTFRPHLTHCHILMRNFNQGRTIIVWSAAGYEWASTVIKALGLEPYVSLIISKPTIYMDDRPMEDWKPQRIYLQRDIEAE